MNIKTIVFINSKLRIIISYLYVKIFKNLYIFDIHPLTKKNISDTVNFCTKNFTDVEFIIFPKNGNEKSLNQLKLPSFLLKDKTVVSGKILENSKIGDDIFTCKNWNINLSNFDIK